MLQKAPRALILMALVSLALGASFQHPVQADHGRQEFSGLVAGNYAFAFDLYRQVAADNNLIFSPYSISQAFAMALAGAQGDTERQMTDVMRFALPQADLHPAFGALNGDLATREAPPEGEGQRLQLNIANALWGQEGFPFRETFLGTASTYYGGGLRLTDFMSAPDQARDDINGWIEEQTEDKIQDMIPEGVIDTMTRLVLVNAIYFNGSWLNPFDEANTQDGPFTLLDGSTVTVPMMFQEESFGYAQGEGLLVVELPYYGGDMAILILLPDEGAFEAVRASLDAAQFEAVRGMLAYPDVRLSMPRFEFETDLDLKTALAAMGMTIPFDPNLADFGGMADLAQIEGNLYISDALHKAYIGVDEAGTEAAAATAILMGVTSAPMGEPIEVRLDRPFIYAIYDRQTGAILFLGQVTNPAG
jgi:serpin B